MPEEMFLDIGLKKPFELPRGKSCFDTELCAKCGERVFVDKLIDTEAGTALHSLPGKTGWTYCILILLRN